MPCMGYYLQALYSTYKFLRQTDLTMDSSQVVYLTVPKTKRALYGSFQISCPTCHEEKDTK